MSISPLGGRNWQTAFEGAMKDARELKNSNAFMETIDQRYADAFGAHDIGWAVAEVRKDHKVRRAGWRDRGTHLVLVRYGDAENVEMRNAPSEKTLPYRCSWGDLLARDWEVAE